MEKEAYTGAGLLAELVSPWGIHTGAACSWGEPHAVGRTHTGAVWSLWVDLMLELLVKGCVPWERPHTRAGALPLSTLCDELMAAPFPAPCTDVREKVEKSEVKLSSGRRRCGVKAAFRFCFYFSLSHSGLICNKLNLFPCITFCVWL